jgi:glutamate formiminotransferase / formiminotetrahydrofolate cyclodeaminase
MKQIVECVANFSEGQRLEVVQQIVDAINAIDGVKILAYESDVDHNRSVITFAGTPDEMLKATFDGIRVASELIDLTVHQGQHPRLGAADVVPFIPIQNVTMDDCIQMAQQLGKQVGGELNIPVYLYEQAATRPERQNLAYVRRGEYEGLKKSIDSDPNRKPDYGFSQVGTAGATVIGARHALIAYNVFLTTDDVKVARKIAKAIRYSSGGLRYVKALGLLVDGRAQVSMNLINYKKTPIYRVVEMIRREAQRYGVGIESSELIGLIPQEALLESAAWYLQMDNYSVDKVLENKLKIIE